MEKFGIFELLDALSVLTAQQNPEAEKPSAQDSAYLPPAYGSPQSDLQAEQAPPQKDEPKPENKPQPHAEGDALAGFYARHDTIAKKAGRK